MFGCEAKVQILRSIWLPALLRFTVNFPNIGDFKQVCLFHPNMTGVVHVLKKNAPLPHNQDFYDRRAAVSDAIYFQIAMAAWSRLFNNTANVRHTTHFTS
jgi:hypothetical protein